MLSKWPIRVKALIGLGLLVTVVTILAGSGLYAMYAYRGLAKSLSWRVNELPVAGRLGQGVADLRITLSELHGLRSRRNESFSGGADDEFMSHAWLIRSQFRSQLDHVDATLDEYRRRLDRHVQTETRITDNRRERATLAKIEAALARVHQADRNENWMLDDGRIDTLDAELERLQALAVELPSHLHNRLGGFARDVRLKYRTLIVGTWATSVSAALLLLLFVQLCWRWVLSPLRVVMHGSRRVAAGDFDHRIHLDTNDEMARLADSFNDMTARFQDIRDDLDRQVRQRTKQVVRSEQLASVGFLAAGVAHEINNPLASIAMCAESLEERLGEIATAAGQADEAAVAQSYLQMIQNEAFRCKEITERLLDFSRIGQVQRQDTELGELVCGVVEMVGHLGKYQRKQIEFDRGQPVVAEVNGQEIKQVVLNLLTNALDSLDDGGTVRIALRRRGDLAELTFADDGCGMEPDVLEHIFEPFFTRRRGGQGTGLGLSITYRIVSDHGGEIEAESAGTGRGTTFRVTLPLAAKQPQTNSQSEIQRRAA